MTQLPPTVDITSPWTTNATAVPYENQWIRIEHNEVTTPGGSDGVYGVVRFKNRAVGVLPVDEHDHTWLIGQYRYALDEYTWEMPAGGCPEGELVEETARRELLEEAGLAAGTLSPLLSRVHLTNSVTDETGWVFVATDLTMVAPEPEDTEELALWRLPVDDAINMVLQDEISDAFTVMALLRLHAIRTSQTS